MDAEGRKEFRDYAWNYFSVHANQRMGVFQFYITLSTAVLGGAVLLAGSGDDRIWSALLFMLLPFLSFVFWRLDQRTSELVKNAEKALQHLDEMALSNKSDHGGQVLALFKNDENAKRKAGRWPLLGHFSYSRCFRYVFVSVALLGVLGAMAVVLTTAKKKSDGAIQIIKIGESGSSPQMKNPVAPSLKVQSTGEIKWTADYNSQQIKEEVGDDSR